MARVIRRSGLPLLLLLAACAWGAAHARSLSEDAASAKDGTVPCAELPEFQGVEGLPPIHGQCRETQKLRAMSFGLSGGAAAGSKPERWIVQWKRGAAAAAPNEQQPILEEQSAKLAEHEAALVQQLGSSAALSAAACAEGADPGQGRFNGSCAFQYTGVLEGFAASFDRGQLASFMQAFKPSIEGVWVDSRVSLHTTVSLSAIGDVAATSSVAASMWGLDRLDQPDLPLDGRYTFYNDGAGVHAYILDTGIRTSHAEFGYADGRPGSRASEAYATPALSASAPAGSDCQGHGSHVAGSVGGLTLGVARGVSLHAMRVLDCAGDGSVADVIAALDWLYANAQRPAIAAMSLGGPGQSVLDAAVRKLTAAGVHVVVAAGNSDADACGVSPAREPSAITVGASDPSDKRLFMATGVGSNYGPCIDMFAPGADILSAAGSSDTARQVRTGTSQAVPYVVGTIALMLQNSSLAPAEVQRLLESRAVKGRVGDDLSRTGTDRFLTGTRSVLLQSVARQVVAVAPAALSAAAGEQQSIAVTLTQPPASDVTVSLASSDPTLAPVQPASLVFTPGNWDKPQAVAVTLRPAALAASSLPRLELRAASADVAFAGAVTAVPVASAAAPAAPTGNTAWSAGAWGTCGADCKQSRAVQCVDVSGAVTDAARCRSGNAGTEPAAQQACTGGACPAATSGGGGMSVAVIGAAVGGIVAVAAVTLAVWWCCRRRRTAPTPPSFGAGDAGSKPEKTASSVPVHEISATAGPPSHPVVSPSPSQLPPMYTADYGQSPLQAGAELPRAWGAMPPPALASPASTWGSPLPSPGLFALPGSLSSPERHGPW